MSQAKERVSSFTKTVRDDSQFGSQEKLGEILCKEGQITKGQLDQALQYQKRNGGRIGSILIKLGYIDADTTVNLLSRKYNFPAINLSDRKIDQTLLKLLPYNAAKEYMAFPVNLNNNILLVTMADPTNPKAIEDLQRSTKLSIKCGVSLELDIVEAYKKYYQISEEEYKGLIAREEEEEKVTLTEVEDFGSIIAEATETFTLEGEEITPEASDQYSASDAPIIKLVNGILIKAIKEGVSDIHLEPFERSLYVRYRLDGSLYKSMNLPIQIKNAIVSRLKIMAKLNISERRIPQDGRIKLKLGKTKAIDFRVSVLPTLFGESIVLRLLDKSSLNVDLTRLGFNQEELDKFYRSINRPYGMILVTGPTGSGKTTTLYSALNVINTVDRKILTAEDPVEYNFPGICQVHIREEIGMTFANALRAFLRQDPDVIMVGEIRDLETAEIAIKAALTGHLVFSTLHTNDCPSTVSRLIDIGVPDYMVASAVSMILAQRLLRRLCQKCKTPIEKISPRLLEEAGFDPSEDSTIKLYYGKGCPACSGTGYKGRIAVYEIMEITEGVNQAILANVSESQLRKIAMREGMSTLRQEALRQARQGVTTLDEVLKKTVREKEILPSYLIDPDEKNFEDGDLIIKEGNTDKCFYKLIQGSLIVVKNNRKIAEITQPDEYFGEMSALLNKERTASVFSRGKSIVKAFPGEQLKDTIENHPEIAAKIITTLLVRLDDANEAIANLTDENMDLGL
jgi:type IV pilus assembly protein PilB